VYIFRDKAIKFKNKNQMGSKTLYHSFREALATGIPLMEIYNKLLLAIVSMTYFKLRTYLSSFF